MNIQIKSRVTLAVLFEGDYPSIKTALEFAVKSGANLSDAILRDANLRGANWRSPPT